jgi:uncharacterized protein (DUF58 family)
VKRSVVLPFLAHLWWFRLTPGSRGLAISGFIASVIGVGSMQIPVFNLVFAMCGVAGAAVVAGYFFRPRLWVEGQPLRKGTAGEVAAATFQVTHKSRVPCFDIGMRFPRLPKNFEDHTVEEIVPGMRQGESGTFRVAIKPHRRGSYFLPHPVAYTTFPLNVWRWPARRPKRGTRVKSSFVVLPNFTPLESFDLPFGRRYQPGGIALTSNVGDSTEYIGNREYRPGDALRKVDYRAWARLGEPAVREFQEEYFCKVALVMDTYVAPRRKPAREGFPDLEAAVSLTASIVDAMSRGESVIEIVCAGPNLYRFGTGRNTEHFDSTLEILACVEPCRQNPFEIVTPAIVEELVRVTSLVCVFLDWDEARRDLVQQAVEAGCSVKIILLRDSEPSALFDGLENVDVTFCTSDQVRKGVSTL